LTEGGRLCYFSSYRTEKVTMEFTHLDEKNRPRMVDVTAKEPSLREAIAGGRVLMRPDTVKAIESGGCCKG